MIYNRIEAQQGGFDSERKSRGTPEQGRLRTCEAVRPRSDEIARVRDFEPVGNVK